MTVLNPGAWVSIEKVQWLPEASTRSTPESLMIEREEEAEEGEERDDDTLRALASDRLKNHLAKIPVREALGFALYLGVCGYPRTHQAEIAEVLGVASQQLVSYMVRRARVRLVYLATRPAVDVAALSSALSPVQVAVIADVFSTASFAEASRLRWVCPADRTGKARHAWDRAHAQRLKRAFFKALAKIATLPELAAQHEALVHLVAHLGVLSHHTGKGTWWHRRPRADAPDATDELCRCLLFVADDE